DEAGVALHGPVLGKCIPDGARGLTVNETVEPVREERQFAGYPTVPPTQRQVQSQRALGTEGGVTRFVRLGADMGTVGEQLLNVRRPFGSREEQRDTPWGVKRPNRAR